MPHLPTPQQEYTVSTEPINSPDGEFCGPEDSLVVDTAMETTGGLFVVVVLTRQFKVERSAPKYTAHALAPRMRTN